jgi:hypothetical protein
MIVFWDWVHKTTVISVYNSFLRKYRSLSFIVVDNHKANHKKPVRIGNWCRLLSFWTGARGVFLISRLSCAHYTPPATQATVFFSLTRSCVREKLPNLTVIRELRFYHGKVKFRSNSLDDIREFEQDNEVYQDKDVHVLNNFCPSWLYLAHTEFGVRLVSVGCSTETYYRFVSSCLRMLSVILTLT